MLTTTVADEILQEARTWIGTPWRKARRVKGGGVDCVNLCAGVFEVLNIIRPLPARPYRDDWWQRAGAIDFQVLAAIVLLQPGFDVEWVEDPRPGDLLLLAQLRRSETTTHVAFMEEGGRIIHARMGRAVCQDILPRHWRISAALRVTRSEA